ncbi:MAG: hypothetical protein NC177_03165 [Ruminococcus flavefaciens]|nr:hypothetical protein [Ruminococcus flavefaciens]
MAFCKYCGKQLSENEICNCRTPNSRYTPDIDLDLENNNSAPAIKKNKSVSKKSLIIMAVIIIAVIIFSAGISHLANAYQRPLKNIVKGINKNNIELILEQVMTDDMLEEFKEENAGDSKSDWKDFCDDTEDGMEELKEYIEDDFGKHFKVSAKIIDKKDAKKREIKSIEKYCKSINMDCSIKKAYKLKTELTLKGKDEEKSIKVWMYSAKLSDEGWKLMFDDETLDDFEYELDDIIDTKVYEDIAEDIF